MKKILSLVLVLLLAAALGVPALADVIWEPDYDDFFSAHRDECVRTEAGFEAQTDAAVYKSPEKRTETARIPAGTEVYVGFTWSGSGDWGYVEQYTDDGEIVGWVMLSEFRKLYGAADFENDHRAEFVAADGGVTVTRESPVVFWTFPGSGRSVGSIGGPEFWEDEETAGFSYVWTDAEGHDWAEINYFYGLRGWVYLPDPAAGDLPATAPRYADGEPAAPAPAQPQAAHRPVGALVTGVVVLAAVTVVLICLIRPKKKGQ